MPRTPAPMLKIRLLYLAQIVVLAAFVTGCEKRASDEIDFGGFENSVYTNSYFGMSIDIPADWTIQDQESQRRMTKLGEKMVAGDDRKLQGIMKASDLQTVNLFVVSKYS